MRNFQIWHADSDLLKMTGIKMGLHLEDSEIINRKEKKRVRADQQLGV